MVTPAKGKPEVIDSLKRSLEAAWLILIIVQCRSLVNVFMDEEKFLIIGKK